MESILYLSILSLLFFAGVRNMEKESDFLIFLRRETEINEMR